MIKEENDLKNLIKLYNEILNSDFNDYSLKII